VKQTSEGFEPFRLVALGWLALAVLAIPLPALAQNCALCYTQAASAGARVIQALRSGILILILPPTLGSVAMIFVMRHKLHQTRRGGGASESGEDW